MKNIVKKIKNIKNISEATKMSASLIFFSTKVRITMKQIYIICNGL